MTIITEQDLINASLDATTLENVVNGDATTVVVSRLGQSIQSLAKTIQSLGTAENPAIAAMATRLALLENNQVGGTLFYVDRASLYLNTTATANQGAEVFQDGTAGYNGKYAADGVGGWTRVGDNELSQLIADIAAVELLTDTISDQNDTIDRLEFLVNAVISSVGKTSANSQIVNRGGRWEVAAGLQNNLFVESADNSDSPTAWLDSRDMDLIVSVDPATGGGICIDGILTEWELSGFVDHIDTGARILAWVFRPSAPIPATGTVDLGVAIHQIGEIVVDGLANNEDSSVSGKFKTTQPIAFTNLAFPVQAGDVIGYCAVDCSVSYHNGSGSEYDSSTNRLIIHTLSSAPSLSEFDSSPLNGIAVQTYYLRRFLHKIKVVAGSLADGVIVRDENGQLPNSVPRGADLWAAGKNIFNTGSSISTEVYFFPLVVPQVNGLNWRNHAVGGATLCWRVGTATNATSEPFTFGATYDEIEARHSGSGVFGYDYLLGLRAGSPYDIPDVVIMHDAYNDTAYYSGEAVEFLVGADGDLTPETYWGAQSRIANELLDAKPTIRFVWQTPLHDFTDGDATHTATRQAYKDATIAMAAKFGGTVANYMDDIPIPLLHAKANDGTNDQILDVAQVHPHENIYDLCARVLYNAIREL